MFSEQEEEATLVRGFDEDEDKKEYEEEEEYAYDGDYSIYEG